MASSSSEVVEVALAPFSGIPKMSFEEVPIGSTMTQSVNLRNPSDKTIKVSFESITQYVSCVFVFYFSKAGPYNLFLH